MLRRLPNCPRSLRPRDTPSGPRRAGPGRTGERRADRQLESEPGLDNGYVRTRHAKSVLCRRRVNDRRQESPVYLGSAQQRHRTRCGAVSDDASSIDLLRDQPVTQSLSVGLRFILQAPDCDRISNSPAGVIRQERSHRSIDCKARTRTLDWLPGESCRRRARSATPSVD